MPRLQPYDRELVERLLRHIRLDAHLEPRSPETLRALHRAFLRRVPYENLEIQLGRPTTIEPVESAERILTGRGGYCYHLNGTFATLLASLGYDVTLISVNPRTDNPDAWGWHVLMLVAFPQLTYLADVGFGDAFDDPLPLAEGTVYQGPFTYSLERRTETEWRFHHDPLGSLDGFDMNLTPMPLRAFDAKHSTDVGTDKEWWAIIHDEFGIHLPDVDAAARAKLWTRVSTAHQRWVDEGRP